MNAPRELVDVGQLDRGSYIGGGDIAALLGVNPWRTPLDVFFAKTGQELPPPKFDLQRDKRLARGKRMEPYIVDMLAEDYGITITARNARYRDPEYPYMAAEIDFEWHDGADERIRNGEIKTVEVFPGTIPLGWGDEGTDEIPIYHAAQSMYGLGITGREVCQYGVLFGMNNLTLYQIARDEETIALQREIARAFWMDHVLPRIPPAPKTLGDLAKLWPKENGKSIVATPEIEAALVIHQHLGDKIRVAEQGREAVEWLIKEFVADNADIIRGADGEKLATYKQQSRKGIDTARLEHELPAIFKQYRTESIFRVLRHQKG
jgi:predicted phage-related endonuclease